MSYCWKCGAQLNPGTRFCPSCGQPVENIETAQQPQPQPAPVNVPNNTYIEQPTQEKSFIKRFWPLIAAAVILLLMVVTVPDKNDHIHAIKSAIMESAADLDNDEAKAGLALGSNIVDKVLESCLHVDNYVLFSVGELKTEKTEKTVSFGILTHVFVGDIDKDKLNDSFKDE